MLNRFVQSIFNFNFMFIACIYCNESIHLNVHVFLLLFVKFVRLSHFINRQHCAAVQSAGY